MGVSQPGPAGASGGAGHAEGERERGNGGPVVEKDDSQSKKGAFCLVGQRNG